MKKKIVQKKLTTSWAVYNKRPAFLSMPPDFKNKTMLIPIKTNSTDHTIGNTLPGGARGGFFNVSNLVIASLVKKDESRPTPVSYTHLDVYKRQVDGIAEIGV